MSRFTVLLISTAIYWILCAACGIYTAKMEIKLNTIYEFRESKESTNDKVVGSLERTSNKMSNILKLNAAGITKAI